MASKSNLQIDESTLPRLAGILNTRILELILLPTEKCNFRCTYCYEDFEMGRMSPEIILGIKNLILNRANDLDRLQLSWFGGEPLAALDVVLEVSGFAAQLAAKKSHLNYRAHMTTNASLLDPATFDKLVDVGVLDYQITLDGPREIHNQTRVQAGGGGTFDRIWNNLLAIRATNLPASIHLRIHFDSETAYRMGPLISDLKQYLLPDSRFAVVFHEIERLGGPNDEQIRSISTEEKNLALAFLNRELYGEHFQPPEPEPYVCYAARPNSLLVRSDGRIGKCTVALNDSRNAIGKLNPDGTLTLDQKRLWPWLRGLEDLDPDVLECPLAGLPTETVSQPLVQLTR